MFDFERPNIEVEEISEDKKYGRFVVEPLERGYGITLGNSLRRIMLSSLPGAAVSQVKIEGVLHEFSSIPGVKEDVTEIIMNIKSLAIKNNSETNEPKTAYIEYEGEGIVRASDIQVDQDIEIMNPDLVIATLSGGKDSKLYMELTITKGRGYVSAETLVSAADLPALLEEEKLPDILERLTQLSTAKIVNLNYITNTDLKATYGVANLTTLMEYDQNYTDLITCLQEYAALLFRHGHPAAALTVLTLALDAGSDIGASYLLAANSYRQLDEVQKIEDLIQKAQNLDSPRSSSIVRALRKSDPDNG